MGRRKKAWSGVHPVRLGPGPANICFVKAREEDPKRLSRMTRGIRDRGGILP